MAAVTALKMEKKKKKKERKRKEKKAHTLPTFSPSICHEVLGP